MTLNHFYNKRLIAYNNVGEESMTTSGQGEVIIVICSHLHTIHTRNFRAKVSPKTKVVCTYDICTLISCINKDIELLIIGSNII